VVASASAYREENRVQGLLVVLSAIAYVTLLFAIASVGDRRAARRRAAEPRPFIYALSLAIYCTSWTFFGSVGLAAERGLRVSGDLYRADPRLPVRLSAADSHHPARQGEKITSIADFLGARYGKSFAVASIATLIATLSARCPTSRLQLKAISGSVSLMVEHYSGSPPSSIPSSATFR
jgi:Na+/proline symporter